jgi:hypothetical protein
MWFKNDKMSIDRMRRDLLLEASKSIFQHKKISPHLSEETQKHSKTLKVVKKLSIFCINWGCRGEIAI